LKEILEPLLGEQNAAQRATRSSSAKMKFPALEPEFGAQMGLQAAYVQAGDLSGEEGRMRPEETREDRP